MAIYNGGLSVKNVSVSTTGDGNAITSLTADGNVITATKGTTFLTSLPNHNHNYAGSASVGGPANSANTLLTKSSSTNADLFVTFVDSNNSTAANETVYTGNLKYNPNNNTLNVGTIVTRENTGPALKLRNQDTYMSTINYDTTGNEALAINLKNTVTSFMVNHGVDGSQWTTNGKWTSVIPTLQAKNKCVYINELIPNDTSPAYNLKVNGTAYFSNKVYIGSPSSYISYNSSTESLDFVFA